MICPITDKPCRTNGCGDKCYKRDSLGYCTSGQHEAKLPDRSASLGLKDLAEDELKIYEAKVNWFHRVGIATPTKLIFDDLINARKSNS